MAVWLITRALGAAALLSACTTQPPSSGAIYCYHAGKSYHPTVTCTPDAVPSAVTEAEAKRFESVSNAMTVYVLRRHWSDGIGVVAVSVDQSNSASTIPNSLVRVRLPPGRHHLSAQWRGMSSDLDIEGSAGSVRFVDLAIQSQGSVHDSLTLSNLDMPDARGKASGAKLVADLDLRARAPN